MSIVQSRDHILNTYSEKISQYAEKRFAREDMRVVTSAFPPALYDSHACSSR